MIDIESLEITCRVYRCGDIFKSIDDFQSHAIEKHIKKPNLWEDKINSLIQEIKQEPVSNNEIGYAVKVLERLKNEL